MMGRSKAGWYDISKVSTVTGKVTESNIDSVFANNTEEAVNKAFERNGLRQNEMFGVRKAVGGVGINQSVFRNTRRTAQIEDFRELMRQHG